jgi:hypothetical protein
MWRPANLYGNSKAPRISPWVLVFPLVGAVVLALFLFQLHIIEIFLGSILIVSGSAATMVALEGVKGAWRKWAIALAIGIILAVGSYITSDGIDRREQYLSDRDALVSFNVERMFNRVTLDALSWAYQNYSMTDKRSFMFGYVPLDFSQARLVLNTTGIVRHDHEFAKAMNRYILSGELVASTLQTLQEASLSLLQKSDFTRSVIQEVFAEKGALPRFLETQRGLESQIASKYQWSNEDVWNRLDRPFFDKMKAGMEEQKKALEMRMRKRDAESKEPAGQ